MSPIQEEAVLKFIRLVDACINLVNDQRSLVAQQIVQVREEVERGRRSDAAAESYARQLKEILRDTGKDGGS